MITKLNLATRPFRNRRTPYLLSAAIVLFSVVTAIFLWARLNENRRLNEVAENQIGQMREELDALNAKGQLVQQQLTPMQRELLVASHQLVANKTFGWSRLFYDLESVIPAGVSASRIVVQSVYRDESDRVKAELDLTVISRDYRSVMAMIGTMNDSPVFSAELRSQNLQSTQRSTYSEYTLRLVYSPPFGVNPEQGVLARTEEGGGE